MNNNYSFIKKKKLAQRIMNIKDKIQLLKIKAIIFEENPSLSVVKNSTGILLYFQNLENITYIKLENFLNNRTLKMCIKKINNINTIENNIFSDINVSSSENLLNLTSNDTDYKYSNKEKNIIRRKQYEETLSELNLSTNSQQVNKANIFIKKVDSK